MKAYNQGCFIRVTLSADDVDWFCESWPCSGFEYGHRLSVTFDKRNGDLVDLALFNLWGRCSDENIDGAAVSAICNDAQAYAAQKGLLCAGMVTV